MIRICYIEDIISVGAFYDNVVKQLDDNINYPHWIYKVYPSEGSVKSMVNKGAQYVCEKNGKIVAAFALNDIPQGSYWKGRWPQKLEKGTYTVIHALAVDPQYRNHRIATEIIRFCIEKSRADGYRAVRVDIASDNSPARKLFERNGFVYAGDVDLELGIGNVPFFSLYERSL